MSEITQAEMTLTAARMTVTYTGQISDGSPQVSRLDAAGGVTVSRPDQTARSQYAVYDLNRRVITMVGGVTLRQGREQHLGRAPVDRSRHRPRDDRRLGRARRIDEPPRRARGAEPGGRVTGRFSVPKPSAGATASPRPRAQTAPAVSFNGLPQFRFSSLAISCRNPANRHCLYAGKRTRSRRKP
jgi:hypothetical protein